MYHEPFFAVIFTIVSNVIEPTTAPFIDAFNLLDTLIIVPVALYATSPFPVFGLILPLTRTISFK